jgi:hypothetical protein
MMAKRGAGVNHLQHDVVDQFPRCREENFPYAPLAALYPGEQ